MVFHGIWLCLSPKWQTALNFRGIFKRKSQILAGQDWMKKEKKNKLQLNIYFTKLNEKKK